MDDVDYQEEPTDVDEDTSEREEVLHGPLTFTSVDEKLIRRITPKQRQSLQAQKNSQSAFVGGSRNQPSSLSRSSSTELAYFQPIATSISTKRKRLDDTDEDEVATRKRPPGRLQLELGYDRTRHTEWNALRVSISTKLQYLY